jgi:hypothetical protein
VHRSAGVLFNSAAPGSDEIAAGIKAFSIALLALEAEPPLRNFIPQ